MMINFYSNVSIFESKQFTQSQNQYSVFDMSVFETVCAWWPKISDSDIFSPKLNSGRSSQVIISVFGRTMGPLKHNISLSLFSFWLPFSFLFLMLIKMINLCHPPSIVCVVFLCVVCMCGWQCFDIGSKWTCHWFSWGNI